MLPNDPSELIRLAIADLERAEHDERYEVDMMVWHEPIGEVCCVCLAGALMAGTLGTDVGESFISSDFSDDDGDKLRALNCFRTGEITEGLGLLGIYRPGWMIAVCPYDDDPDRFKREMLELADTLETYDATK